MRRWVVLWLACGVRGPSGQVPDPHTPTPPMRSSARGQPRDMRQVLQPVERGRANALLGLWDAFLVFLKGHPQIPLNVYAAMMLSSKLCLRIGQIMNLRAMDFDFKRKRVYIAPWKKHLGFYKPMLKPTIEFMRTWRGGKIKKTITRPCGKCMRTPRSKHITHTCAMDAHSKHTTHTCMPHTRTCLCVRVCVCAHHTYDLTPNVRALQTYSGTSQLEGLKCCLRCLPSSFAACAAAGLPCRFQLCHHLLDAHRTCDLSL